MSQCGEEKQRLPSKKHAKSFHHPSFPKTNLWPSQNAAPVVMNRRSPRSITVKYEIFVHVIEFMTFQELAQLHTTCHLFQFLLRRQLYSRDGFFTIQNIRLNRWIKDLSQLHMLRILVTGSVKWDLPRQYPSLRYLELMDPFGPSALASCFPRYAETRQPWKWPTYLETCVLPSCFLHAFPRSTDPGTIRCMDHLLVYPSQMRLFLQPPVWLDYSTYQIQQVECDFDLVESIWKLVQEVQGLQHVILRVDWYRFLHEDYYHEAVWLDHYGKKNHRPRCVSVTFLIQHTEDPFCVLHPGWPRFRQFLRLVSERLIGIEGLHHVQMRWGSHSQQCALTAEEWLRVP